MRRAVLVSRIWNRVLEVLDAFCTGPSLVRVGTAMSVMVLITPGSRSDVGAARTLALSVNFAPGSGMTFTTANPTIQISGCDTFYQVEDAIITVNGNGVQYTTQPAGSGNCATSFSRRFDVTAPGFIPGANTVVATVFNANGDSQQATATYYYDQYAVQVFGGSGQTVAPGATGSVSFTVSNTGGTNATADLSVQCPTLASCSIVGQDPRPINAGQSAQVTVNFTAGTGDGPKVITLTATYLESTSTTASANVTVTVLTPVDHVSIAPSPPIQVGVGQNITLTATTYDANNNILTGRTVTWSVGPGGYATVSPSTGISTTLSGQSPGATTVMATSEGKSATSSVNVGSIVAATVSFLPASGTHFTSAAQPVIVRGCHPTLPVTDAIPVLNGSISPPIVQEINADAACGGHGTDFHINLTLPANQNNLAVTVSVNNGEPITTSSATYFYDFYAISTTPDGAQAPPVVQNGTGSLPFTVTNTGNVAGNVAVVANCPAGFSCSTSPSTPFVLNPQGFQNVQLNFTASAVVGNHTVGLTATYLSPGTGSNPGSYTVPVTPAPVVVADVEVVLNASVITPGTQTAATATLRDASGNVITGQSVTWSSSAPTVATVTSTGALTGNVAAVALGQAYTRAVASNGVKDSALVTVQSSVPGAVIAATNAGLNPGTSFARDLCLIASLGSDASSECGDLRVAHPLPSVLVKNVTQQPTLLYSSATAHPHPLVGVNVQYTSGTRPDSVEAILRVNGVLKRRGAWLGASMQLNVASRLVIGYDAIPSGSGDPTGIYPYTVEVAPFNANVRGTPVTVSGQLAIVNRAQSRFGPGWWLAGLEQLFAQGDGSLLWVGADGSARRYASAGANLWVPQQLDFPDTIRLASSKYTRFAPGGVKVRFNNVGNHVATVRPLGDSTVFVYNVTGLTPQLDTIRTLISSRYSFTYNGSGRLTSVTAPPIQTVARVTTVAIGGNGGISSITDPDLRVVGFGYDATFPRRMTSRTDRRSTVTTFSYDAGWKVSQSSIAMDAPTPPIVTQIRSAETKGVVAATGLSAFADTALAYSLIDGPRTDVGDSTRFWLDLRLGAPQRIADALGFVTRIDRTNATYPALVTRVQRPNGHVQRIVYDARGHVYQAIDSGGIVAGREEVTRYEWNNAFDLVERIVPQMQDSITRAYDPTNGNILWQEDARGSISRVNFRYYPTSVNVRHLLRAIQYPATTGTVVDSFAYDVRLYREKAAMVDALATGVTGPAGRAGSLFRFGKQAETVEKLAIDAAREEARGFGHGVSTTTRRPTRTPASAANREAVEAEFRVHQTGADKAHHTVILPKPVTQEIANLFNRLFNRIP